MGPAFLLITIVLNFTSDKFLTFLTMEELLDQIHNIEQKHLYALYKHMVKVFENTNLPSHDALHHLRVWLHCRGLIIELHKAGIDIPDSLIENAIVACFFHDSGLTIDIGEMHGKLGGKICRDYYEKHPEINISNIDAIIQAIEFHDEKTSKQALVSTMQDMICLNRLVSTADDLDAFGIVGIFRYTEIYLKRGVVDNELPTKVIKNIKNRFTNFTNAYSSLHRFSDKQRLRYIETINFFMELDSQIIQSADNTDSPLAVYKILKEQLVENEKTIDDTIAYAISKSTTSYPLQFFSKLRNELNVTSAILI